MGGSFGKILLVAVVFAVAWFGWRWFQRWEKERRYLAERREDEESVRRRRSKDDPVDVQDLSKCRICGAFVSAGAKACERSGCPYPR